MLIVMFRQIHILTITLAALLPLLAAVAIAASAPKGMTRSQTIDTERTWDKGDRLDKPQILAFGTHETWRNLSE